MYTEDETILYWRYHHNNLIILVVLYLYCRREVGEYGEVDESLQGLVVDRGGREIMVTMDSLPNEITIKFIEKGNKKYVKVVPQPTV